MKGNLVQVGSKHYEFTRYCSKGRWASYWHQIDEVLRSGPDSVLEIGPGAGILRFLLESNGVACTSVDIDQSRGADCIASVETIPFESRSYPVVCAFQVLEHLPYDSALSSLAELARVSQKVVIISLPDAKKVWQYTVYVPKVGEKRIRFDRPRGKPEQHVFDGQHYWELGKAGYPVSRFINDASKEAGLALRSTYRVWEFPYHRFFRFEVKGDAAGRWGNDARD